MAVKDSESIQSAFPTHKESFLRPNNLGMCISAESSKLQTKNQNSTYFIHIVIAGSLTNNKLVNFSAFFLNHAGVFGGVPMVCPVAAPVPLVSPRLSSSLDGINSCEALESRQTATNSCSHPRSSHGHPRSSTAPSSAKQCQAVPSSAKQCQTTEVCVVEVLHTRPGLNYTQLCAGIVSKWMK